MITEEILSQLEDIAVEYLGDYYDEPRRRHVFAVTRDVVDYFTDVARVTDRVEMGGVLLGKIYRRKSCYVTIFYDYVQIRNVAESPETRYVPDESSLREVFSLIRGGRYDVFTSMHTHPDEAVFSPADIVRAFVDFRYLREKMRLPRELKNYVESGYVVPSFLVTDGYHPLLLMYSSYGSAFVAALILDEMIIPQMSTPLRKWEDLYELMLTSIPDLVARVVGDERGIFSAFESCRFVHYLIRELEAYLEI